MDCHKAEATKARGIVEVMTEKGDFPEGSFELDPDSLATYQLGIFASYIDQRATTNFMDSVNYAENWVASVPNQVPKPEFYKFADERSREKFQIGQCWAIYNDEDALPRYYRQIKKIALLREFVLHVAWFYACPLPKSAIRTFEKGCMEDLPRKAEVLAVYKSWSPQLMKGNNLEDFQYEMVEIVDVSDNYVDVKFLALVKGFKSIYMARAEEKVADKVVKVCASEHLRFSHQIPAFCLTEERGGSLRGFWELDPAEMPSYLVCTD